MGIKLTRYSDLVENGEVVKGTWELLSGHEIGYRAEGRDEEIRFKAPMIAAEPSALVMAATVRQDDQTVVTRTVKITGRWKTDGKNRIVFEAERSGGRTDQMVLSGTWKLNDSQEIVYTYRGRDLKTRRTREQEIVFRGYWELSGKRRITYVLGGDSESAFRFRGTFQSPSLLAKKGEIRFQVGAEVAGRAARGGRGVRGGLGGRSDRGGRKGSQTVTLFGVWKVSRDLSLSFELDQPGTRKQVFRFGGDFSLTGPRTLSMSLRSERGEPLGVELVLTRDFLGGDGQVFGRLARSTRESLVEAGGRIRF